MCSCVALATTDQTPPPPAGSTTACCATCSCVSSPGSPADSSCCLLRYVAEGTIEERMLALQERKRQLGKAAFDRRSAEQLQRMRTDDIRLLMEL
jgi:hypothetical protein